MIPSEPSADEVAARVAAVVGGGSGLSATAEEIAWAVRRFLEGLARERPVILVLDDVHWAEPSFLDLVDQLTDWSRDAPILVICMARPELLESSPGWGGGKLHATTVALEPLSGDEVAHLVENFLAGGVLDDALRRRIDEAAGGNPLFVEETLAMLVDDGLLRQRGRAMGRRAEIWTRSRFPPTIQALLAARLDRLDDADRLLMGRASIVGLSFYLGALRDLTPEPERGEVAGRVRQLLRRDLIRPDASDVPGEEAFRFHHVLLRDAAYQMLPKEIRAGTASALRGLARRAPRGWPTWTSSSAITSSRRTCCDWSSVPRTTTPGRSPAARPTACPRPASVRGTAATSAPRRTSTGARRRSAAPTDPQRARDLLALAWSLVDRDHDR